MLIPSTISITISFLMILLAMAFYTLMERKFLGYFHLRKGPNKVSLMGIPQPFADAMKLFFKEQVFPFTANKTPFIMAPMLGLMLALLMWVIFPHQNNSFWMQFGVLYFMCVSSMNVYSTFIAGWGSNSKYALLGALRGIAQTISYEISMALILISMLTLKLNMDFTLMTNSNKSWVILMLLIVSIMWFISILAETNRTPFDFAEGESELVSGFNVEYSSGMFALIFMAEYTSILAMSVITSALFFSSTLMKHSLILILFTTMISILFIWVRATLPRMRYDFLMALTWKTFLPLILAMLMILMPLKNI
uniref:NADH-ubiquinone oxidoreductase chain 1 n=1 Tax=Lumbriculus variegatus TaxID=61662 RepID=A0A7D6W3G0_9ANNE|nr:NADH dehydrogenase subunit 1 [Lumbriculus variegatus]QLY89733.1 NADH dehydrogenase subunit 1 [Lumbriculus variegatus]UZT67745.1 NADH dehydrogenase subunit 1 [Lumbriculus variegatus]FAA04220.1 TPA: NADH dehydrogenase subunit 1 [Lumbriculus variegatus]